MLSLIFSFKRKVLFIGFGVLFGVAPTWLVEFAAALNTECNYLIWLSRNRKSLQRQCLAV